MKSNRLQIINIFHYLSLMIIFISLLIFSGSTLAKRTIHGKITDKNNKPLSSITIKAYDADSPDSDDYMGTTKTNKKGEYRLSYKGGHWDDAPHNITIWRPDIYIQIFENGRKIEQSKVYKDRKHKYDTLINLKAPKIVYVEGKIVDQNRKPVSNIRVVAFDDDSGSDFFTTALTIATLPIVAATVGIPVAPIDPALGSLIINFATSSKDDFMGIAVTDANGYFKIPYRGGHWDTAPHNITSWRPDVYIKMYYKQNGGWKSVGQSGIKKNHKLRNRLFFNNEPVQITGSTSGSSSSTGATPYSNSNMSLPTANATRPSSRKINPCPKSTFDPGSNKLKSCKCPIGMSKKVCTIDKNTNAICIKKNRPIKYKRNPVRIKP